MLLVGHMLSTEEPSPNLMVHVEKMQYSSLVKRSQAASLGTPAGQDIENPLPS